jgi:hypothetical protein
LWRELHRREPVQLQLAFKDAAKHRRTQDSAEEASVPATFLPLQSGSRRGNLRPQ